MVTATPKAIEALMKVNADDQKEMKERLEDARKDARLAENEVKTGFPILHSWAVVGVWALFEAMIRTFVAQWLRHKRTAWRAEAISSLNIKLGEYESIPRNERHRLVVEMLEKGRGARMRDGVNQFEAMLEPFGLSGPLPRSLKQDMYEFGQVRNLIAHNASRVDRRFAKACPWLKTKIGEEFRVSPEMYMKYLNATVVYVTLIVCRVGEHYGTDMSDQRNKILDRVENGSDTRAMDPGSRPR